MHVDTDAGDEAVIGERLPFDGQPQPSAGKGHIPGYLPASASPTACQDDKRVHRFRGSTDSFTGIEATPLLRQYSGSASDMPAELVLRALAPRSTKALKERLRRERIQTAADLAGLDKDDLRDLGLTMVERSRVLNWARQVFFGSMDRQRTGSGDSMQELHLFPGTPGDRPDLEITGSSPEDASRNGQTTLTRNFSDQFGNLDTADYDMSLVIERHLDDVETRADFWCRIVIDSGTSFLRSDVEQVEGALSQGGEVHLSDLRENVLEKLFDLSPERLKEVYESIDRDSDGRIIKEELREGLHRCELHGLDGALEKVLSVVGHESGSLQLVEFESVLTRLKLAQLLCTPKLEKMATNERLTVMDYNSKGVEELKVSLRDYFFGHRTQDFPMRWIHLRHFELTLLLALTVKYQLHPLSVEDVIDQAPTKIDRYEGHYFAAIEHLEVTGAINGHEPVKIRGRHVTIFCAGPPHLDTVITVTQADRSLRQDWPGEVDTSEGQEDVWVSRLTKRLRMLRSRVRERRADFLMYEIIDLCTDDLRLVTRVYTARLNWLEDRLQKDKISSEQNKLDWFNEVGLVRLQLAVVSRRLRGLQRILRRLADDPDVSTVLTGYLQDVADHVNEAYEDAGHLGEKCSTLSDAYEHAEDRAQDKIHRENAQTQTLQDERMNKMLFILTILTTIFTPLTFIAGIYGMNFQDGNGTPSIPELLWPDGYYYFWMLTIVYLLIAGCIGIWLWRRVHRSRRPRPQMPLPVHHHEASTSGGYTPLPAGP